MLEKVRKPGRAKTITAYVIFGAICLVFVFFGVVPSQFGFQQGGAAAVINDTQISLSDFSRRMEAMERQYGQQLQSLPEAQRQSEMTRMRAQVLEQLVESELLYQSASQAGIYASDAEVREMISQIPVFQEEGRFRRDFYSQYLQGMGYTPSQFEEQIRKDIVVDKVRNLFLASFVPVQGEEKKSQMLADTKLELDLISFDQKQLENSLPVTQADLQNFLKNPENLKQAQEHYEKVKNQYSQPEQVRARHILIAKDPEKPESEETLKAKVELIQNRLKTEDFATVAKEVSADTASAQKGGDLGFFSRGRMVEEFEAAAFSLEPGVISEPIQTQYGYHIIRVEEKKPASTQSFEEVQNEIAQQLLAQPKVEESLKKIREYVQNSNESELNAFLKDLGWKWESTGNFDLTSQFIPKLGQNEKVLTQVARHPKPGKLIPELVESGGQYYIIKVKDLKLASPQEEKSRVAEFISMRRASAAFETWLKNEKAEAKIQRNPQLLVN